MIIFFETFKFEPPFVFPMWVQWFFGSVPNNPMMLEVCDAIVLRLSESPPVDWKKSRPGLRTLYITGPFVWSKIINGFEARVLQHEIDHLEGKLMVDYVSPIKRERIKKKLTKIYAK